MHLPILSQPNQYGICCNSATASFDGNRTFRSLAQLPEVRELMSVLHPDGRCGEGGAQGLSSRATPKPSRLSLLPRRSPRKSPPRHVVNYVVSATTGLA